MTLRTSLDVFLDMVQYELIISHEYAKCANCNNENAYDLLL